MRNIYIIPTDKPSRFIINWEKDLCYKSKPYLMEGTQHIYITNSEEVKEGCLDLIKYKNHTLGWYLMIKNNSNVLIKYDGSGLYFNTETTKIFKIILTTDTKLIEDGVQEVEDEFLEWFVNNSNCEFVDTKLFILDTDDIDEYYESPEDYPHYYEIIIPKEEV